MLKTGANRDDDNHNHSDNEEDEVDPAQEEITTKKARKNEMFQVGLM